MFVSDDDINILFLNNSSNSLEIEKYIKPPLLEHMTDYNNDGNISISVLCSTYDATISNPEFQNEIQIIGQLDLVDALADSKNPIMIVDDEYYKSITTYYNIPLLNFSDLSKGKITGNKMQIKDIKIAGKFAFLNDTIDNMYICVVDINKLEDKYLNNKGYMQKYKNHLDFIEKVI